jgi:hypothetical protein
MPDRTACLTESRPAGDTTGLNTVLELVRHALCEACASGPDLVAGPFRGLALSEADVAAFLDRRLDEPRFGGSPGAVADAMRDWPPGALLAGLYELGDFDLAVIALAMAPEVDERFGTAMAWLQDDITRRRPAPSLALNLFTSSPEELAARRTSFGAGAPLRAQRLLASPDPALPVVSAPLVLDAQIRRVLLSEPGLDSRLSGWCRLLAPWPVPPPAPPLDNVVRLLEIADDVSTLRLAVGGPGGAEHRAVACAIAAARSRAVLRVDLEHVASLPGPEARELLSVLVREAMLFDAVLDLAPAEVLRDPAPAWFAAAVTDVITTAGVPVVLRSDERGPVPVLPGAGLLPLELAEPTVDDRRACWTRATADLGLELGDRSLDQLAQRYRLFRADIDAAAHRAAASLAWGLGPPDPFRACAAQARATGGHRLTTLARRVEPRFGWQDLVLPESTATPLRELCDRAAVHDQVLGRCGFAGKLSLGRGIAALFAGPSGTGKSMAAEVIAGTLGVDLFRVDLAAVVDKYIGETEKNLDAVFSAAEGTSAILLFDEADALFGRRSEVRDAHDRYANLEVSYLLQRMEEYEGLAILSTNLHANLDDAFTRRLATIVWFPFPEPAQRAELWRQVWPAELLRDPIDEVDLAERFPLSGGGIKAVALAAAGLAVAEGRPVGAEHILRAVQREYQKVGRTLTPAQLGTGSDR